MRGVLNPIMYAQHDGTIVNFTMMPFYANGIAYTSFCVAATSKDDHVNALAEFCRTEDAAGMTRLYSTAAGLFQELCGRMGVSTVPVPEDAAYCWCV